MKYQNLLRITLPLLVLGAGVVAWEILNDPVEPPAPEKRARRKLETETLVLNPQDYQITLQSQGTVRATQTTILTPLVSGTVVAIDPSFEDGAFFEKGDTLLTLDPADFVTNVLSAKSRLARAEAVLVQEEARAEQAALNWRDIGFAEKPSPLVLRIPQLKEARAGVSAAQADLEKAQRDLSRTEVKAPFDGRVDQRLVGLGQSVGSTTPLGEIFGSQSAEIRLPLSPSQLKFIKLPKRANDLPVSVKLFDPLQYSKTPNPASWDAKIVRTEGALDPDSRELFAIAIISDPFDLDGQRPELRIGQPMRAEVGGTLLKDVFVFPRSAMRGMNRIILIDQKNPKIIRKDITPIWSNEKVIVVSEGLSAGDRLAISKLSYAPQGAPVTVIPTPENPAVSETEKPDASGKS